MDSLEAREAKPPADGICVCNAGPQNEQKLDEDDSRAMLEGLGSPPAHGNASGWVYEPEQESSRTNDSFEEKNSLEEE